jgi:hypothetical protein
LKSCGIQFPSEFIQGVSSDLPLTRNSISYLIPECVLSQNNWFAPGELPRQNSEFAHHQLGITVKDYPSVVKNH